MTRTKMCASPRVTPSSLPPPHLFTNNIRNNFLPPPRCLLLLLLRGRHRPRFPACRHHHRNNIASPSAAAASAGAFLKCALDESLLAVQPPRGASLSLLQTHTRRRRRRRRRPVCFLLFDIRAPLLCVCPPSVSLVVIYNTYMLLAKILLSLLPTTFDTIHTHTERLTPPTSLTTHVHLNTHTISHTHPWKEDHKDRDLKYYLPPQQHQPTSPLRICNNVSTGNENKSLKLSHRRRRVERPFSERGALCGAWKIRGTL